MGVRLLVEWHVVYQDEPFNYTNERALVVEAKTKVHAFLIARNLLTRQGHTVSTVLGSHLGGSRFTEEERQQLPAWKASERDGRTHILFVEPYKAPSWESVEA